MIDNVFLQKAKDELRYAESALVASQEREAHLRKRIEALTATIAVYEADGGEPERAQSGKLELEPGDDDKVDETLAREVVAKHVARVTMTGQAVAVRDHRRMPRRKFCDACGVHHFKGEHVTKPPVASPEAKPKPPAVAQTVKAAADSFTFQHKGKTVVLTKHEYVLADRLRAAIGKGVMMRNTLLGAVWPAGGATQPMLSGLAASLQVKLSSIGLVVKRVPDMGYVMEVE